MKRTSLGVVFNTILVGGLLSSLMLGGTAYAGDEPTNVTFHVSDDPETGGTITFSGTGCISTPEKPATVILTAGRFKSVIPAGPDGYWSHTASIEKNTSELADDTATEPFAVFDSPPGTYDTTAFCDDSSGILVTLQSKFTVKNATPPVIALEPTCVVWYGCESTLQNLSEDDYANQHGGVDVSISNFTTSARLNPTVTVTSPEGDVWELADRAAVLAEQERGEPLDFSYYDGGESPQLGVYTVTVKDDYESASANFTVVPNDADPTTAAAAPTTPTQETENTPDLAQTGVKLDVPVALSTAGLMLLAGAGAVAYGRRRENDTN